MRGGFVFTTPIRLHLGVLGGLYLLSVAAGYQLDKYELVYSGGGVATGVSYTDQAARFFAFDVLTIISPLAAALLVGGAFTRLLWPLGGAIVVWFVASIALGTVYPEIVQRFVVNPDPFSREEPYIRNNIAMTRLAFGIDDWDGRDYRGDAHPVRGGHRGRAGDLPERPAVGLPAARHDDRPAPDLPPLLRLHRRRHRPLRHRR